MNDEYTRRTFLETAGKAVVSGMASFLLPPYLGSMAFASDSRLPTTTDVRRKNLADLLLDLELAYGRNGAIPSTREPDTKSRCIARLERIAESFERMTTPLIRANLQHRRFHGIGTQEAQGLLLSLDRAITSSGLQQPPQGIGISYLTQGLLGSMVDCDIYSFVALGIAERYGIPLYGVESPIHFFTRWQSPSIHLNFDQGLIRESDQRYIDGSMFNPPTARISEGSITRGAYLRSLRKQETVAIHLVNIAMSLLDNHEYETALDLTTLATRWAPHSTYTHLGRSSVLSSFRRPVEALDEYRRAVELDPTRPARTFYIGF